MKTATKVSLFLLVIMSLLLAACGRAPQAVCNTSVEFTVNGQKVYQHDGLATFDTASKSYLEDVSIDESPKAVLMGRASDFLAVLGLGDLKVDFFSATNDPAFAGGIVDWGQDHQDCNGFSKTVELVPYLETDTTVNSDGSGLGLTTSSYTENHVVLTVKTDAKSPNGGVSIVFLVPKERLVGHLILALKGSGRDDRYLNVGEREFADMQDYAKTMCQAATMEPKMEAIRFRFMASSHEEEIAGLEILVRVLGFVSFDYPPGSMAVLSAKLESGEQVSAHLFTNNGSLVMLPFHTDPDQDGLSSCQSQFTEMTSIFDVFEGMVYFVK